MNTLIMIMLLMPVSLYWQTGDNYTRQRELMVSSQIAARGITHQGTLRAMRRIPRHLFVPDGVARYAYDDTPLPIGYNQTISQPFIVAWMTELANPDKRKKALEIGTGSGYQAAVLAETAGMVYTIEIVPELARDSEILLKKLGYTNIVLREGDGYMGWEENAPFDIIVVTAACDHIPRPLIDQLAENGRLVMPLGDPGEIQKLILITKQNGKTTQQTISEVRFVPLTRRKKTDIY